MPMTAPYENKEYVVGFIEEWIAHAQSANHIVPTTSLDVQVLKAVLKLLKDCSSGPSHKPAAVEALKGVLDEIEDYLEQRQDVRDGSDGPRANTEMSLLSDLRWWRDSAGMCSATPQHTKEDV
jgi:hypothetical protein